MMKDATSQAERQQVTDVEMADKFQPPVADVQRSGGVAALAVSDMRISAKRRKDT